MTPTPIYDSDRTVQVDESSQESGQHQQGLTVAFRDVSIRVHGLGEDFGSTCLSVLADLFPFAKSKTSPRHILHDVTGQVQPGEMLLVLGRPGSGCTSLLKVISNQRNEFHHVSGDVRYGNLGHKGAQQFRNQVVMNTEDDLHFPTLEVKQTIDFATSNKLPGSRPDSTVTAKEYLSQKTDAILNSLAIGHTKNTMVGDEVTRGVSGGERKRVSIAEVMATQAPVQCWDNSTRGLDASNALDFVRVLRTMADEERKSIVATLYQAGNGIYDLFDKVLVLAEGREIYYGPTSEAKQYFENMGFECTPGANISDFLTSVSVPTERQIRPGYEDKIPTSPADFEDAYKSSPLFDRMTQQMNAVSEKSLSDEVESLLRVRDAEKNRSLPFLSRQSSPYQVSFMSQITTCIRRQCQIIWGDRWSTALQIASALIMALVTGSLFYDLPSDSTSIFTRPGALFFPIQLFAMNKMSETTASFMGRRIISRHKRLAFNRPAAYALACTATDIPLVIVMYSLFQLVYYFMVDLQREAGHFFTNWFMLVLCTLCFASLFRMIGAWCKHFGLASQITGWMTMVYMVYAGKLGLFQWSIMAEEMGDLTLNCVEPQLIPFGSTYDSSQYRSCTVRGSVSGSTLIDGETYMNSQYAVYKAHIWRNAGILIGFWIFLAFMTAVGFEINLHSDSGSKVLFDRRSRQKEAATKEDTEKADESAAAHDVSYMSLSKTVFTFKDISYFVRHEGKDLQLLRGVSGYVKPGQLVALMGSSGAGKTTLMDVLAQRKDSGRIEGSIMVNGKPQGISFQRTTGYCEQNDVHEPTSTVWESLLFSARLRQSHKIPDEEKQDYVRGIMELLELTPLQHAIVGTPGSGLSIEQRKRLTLATELVAKPSLLFLDEPTSGLDGQSAYEICRFMRRLAASGQTIICTIHQPSATLFDAFDVLLLLARGGRTTYFGPTGKNSATVIDYFARNGTACPPHANPAEHIVDVVQGRFGTEIDWPQTWLDSPERQAAITELDALNSNRDEGKDAPPSTTADEVNEDQLAGFATPVSYQVYLVTCRQLVALWRNPDYVWNKIGLHITNGLFGGFSYWMLGDGTFDLQLRLMAVFNFVFVAPGCINQLQPLFIQNRDVFETREKKSKTYHWFAFVAAQLLSEIPVLIVCGTLAFATWYFTVGFPTEARISGQVYLEMILYEFLYTSLGQAIAAYSPNAYFAALANPIIIGAALINFCGVVVPYSQITAFWRYWLYWLDPFTYLIQGMLEPVVWDVEVHCKSNELTYIPLPGNSTCGEYLADFLSSEPGYVVDPGNSTVCAYCPYSTGADYMRTMNINDSSYGWRGVGITALFCVSSYALVFLMMKLRTKTTKTAN
ncbi:multidrug resistance protein CDR1 [Colletotrichum orchidophilum]|uniref:Multidrug resistance protein CDR1 n=1 Tax=Colletotrichum orchidophilum TaxID=1209926 RepID=A0A1G4BDA9_9PEZI|nr:multidrug resistance protein CDR1 [Colletotrichum orchidophilum]OHE99429.1 multidrug resistance protein CDR1 [Colletotrichum orchidophilum]